MPVVAFLLRSGAIVSVFKWLCSYFVFVRVIRGEISRRINGRGRSACFHVIAISPIHNWLPCKCF